MQVHAGEPERRRQKCRGRLAVGAEGLAVDVQLGVELSRSPAEEDLLHGIDVDLQQLGNRFQVRRQRDDLAHVEVAIGPAVEPPADALAEVVVGGRVTEGAGDAHRRHPVAVERRLHAHDRVVLEERDGVLRIVERERVRLDHVAQRSRDRAEIDAQAQPERVAGSHALADAAMLFAGDDLVEPQLAAEERLAAEGVEPEDLAPLVEHLPGVVVDRLLVALRGGLLHRRILWGFLGSGARAGSREQGHDRNAHTDLLARAS